jgi:NAD(P)-dependent dehydrogenase (short-subunit alcohol dehydrogenase family)
MANLPERDHLHHDRLKDPRMHPALAPGRVAVITGAASGIGLAAAQRFAALGMRICIADIDEAALAAAAETMPNTDLLTVKTDVSQRTEIEALQEKALSRFGEVAVLMNNAGREQDCGIGAGPEVWARILDTNLWGVIHGVQVFSPGMVAQGTPCAIINTGSKQGITTPPGNTAYNVSKAGIKVVTEALAHDLREAGSAVTAHLLIPGFTFTGFTRKRVATKPDAAWMPEQVVEMLVEGMTAGDFYILCPDNDVTRAMDDKRVLWAAEDVIKNRPALSRWHPDYKDEFAAFMAQ